MPDRTSLLLSAFPFRPAIAGTFAAMSRGTKAGFGMLLLATAFVTIAAVTASAADKAPGWDVKVDSPAARLEWPKTLKYTIPQPPRLEELLFPTTPSHFCLAGLDAYESSRAELWNLATGERVGGINGAPQKAIKRALSSDGKFLALAVLDRAKANEVEVWSLESGKRLSTFAADEKSLSMTILDFAGPAQVLTYTFGQQGGKFVHHLRIWDADTGKSIHQHNLDKNLSGDTHYTLSPGGNWLASIVTPEVRIYDLQTGQVKGTISTPQKTEEGDHVSTRGIRFSPDGAEFAILSEGSKASLVTVHDVATGAVALQRAMPASMKSALQHSASYKGPAIDFVTQPAGFLWYGSGFVDRKSGLLVWSYQQGILEFSHWKRTLTPAGFILSTGGNGARKIEVLPFPAEKLEKTLAAYLGDVPAIIKPGEKVKVVVKVGAVRFGKPDEARQSIETVLAERLAEDGLEVSDDGGTILTIDYKEMAGKVLQEFKGGNAFGGGVATGRTVQSTAGEVKMKWMSKDGKTKIFEHTLNLDPSFLTVRKEEKDAKITDENARAQVFEILKIQLASLAMPFFFPQDKSLAVLPLTTSSSLATPLSPQDALKKKIEARKNLGKKK